MRLIFLVVAIFFATAGAAPKDKFRKVAVSGPLGEIWEDTVSGLYWSGLIAGRYDRDQAKVKCAELSAEGRQFRLPTQSEFLALENHHGREILPDMKDRFYWTATAHSKSPNVRLVFNGNSGRMHWVQYNNIAYDSTRCVASAGAVK